MPIPSKIWTYRITHIDNLDHILKYGLVTAASPNANPDFIQIGDNTMIEFRRDLNAPDPPGGLLTEYIPFYLGPRSPMLFQIATGYDGIKKYPQEEIVYIISSLDKIKQNSLIYFFSDGHVRSSTSAKYIDDECFSLLDWGTIYAEFWRSDETDLRRKEKKQAELLVKHHVPLNCIEYIGVFNSRSHQKVLNLLDQSNNDIKVKISPQKLYYDHL